jgi:hypothetical protein
LFQKLCATVVGVMLGTGLTYAQTDNKRMADFDGDGKRI